MKDERFLSAKDAAGRLGVSLPTLYAYVSRGQIHAEKAAGGRASRYSAADVDRLRQRKRRGRGAEAIAQDALNFGTPVLASGLTLIADGRLYYRGRDATTLAEHASLEDVARLLWQTDSGADPFDAENLPPAGRSLQRAWLNVVGLAPIDRCLALLPQAAVLDDRALLTDRAAMAACGTRMVRLLTAIVAAIPANAEPVHRILARAWKVEPPVGEIMRAALVLCADHELNASAFTVRVIAATGATLYGSAQGGLSALKGPRHGGTTPRTVAFFEQLATVADLRGELRARLEAGERLPGFGHWLYPAGDPRAAYLLARLRATFPGSPALDHVLRVAEAGEAMIGYRPNLDFSLAAIELVCRLPAGSGLALFLLGRAAGWVAHHLEQSESAALIRPRARYVGPPPQAEPSSEPAAP